MNQKQLYRFQKNTIMTCNEIFHYLTYLLEMYAAIMACLVMADIKNTLLYGLFAAAVFFTVWLYHRARIWVRDDGKRVWLVSYMRYLPINWKEYFRMRIKMLAVFYTKTAALTVMTAITGYYLFHRGFDWYMLFGILKEFLCLTVLFFGVGFYALEQEKRSCCFI